MLYTLPVGDGEDPESALISESGAMNVFFLWDKVGLIRLSHKPESKPGLCRNCELWNSFLDLPGIAHGSAACCAALSDSPAQRRALSGRCDPVGASICRLVWQIALPSAR